MQHLFTVILMQRFTQRRNTNIILNLKNPSHPNRAIQPLTSQHTYKQTYKQPYVPKYRHIFNTSISENTFACIQTHRHAHTHTSPLVWMVTLRAGLRATGLFPAPGWNLLSADLCQSATALCGEVGTGIRGSPHSPTERSTYHILLPHSRYGCTHMNTHITSCPATALLLTQAIFLLIIIYLWLFNHNA